MPKAETAAEKARKLRALVREAMATDPEPPTSETHASSSVVDKPDRPHPAPRAPTKQSHVKPPSPAPQAALPSHAPTAAPQQTTPPASKKKKARAAASVAVTATATALSAAAPKTSGVPKQPNAATSPPPPPRKGRRAAVYVALAALMAFAGWVAHVENIKFGIHHTDVSLGPVNLSVPVPRVDMSGLSDVPDQLLATLGTLTALFNAGNGTGAMSDLLPADMFNTSVGEVLDRIRGAIAGQDNGTAPSHRPGAHLAAKGYRAKHPVIIVPGFVTSQLELWQGQPCAAHYFRQRMWGTLSMMQMYMRDRVCWSAHLGLDPVTGLDPPGVKLRAAEGMQAVDFFVQGYWVWHKVLEALADIGYDANNIATAAYDWRLAIPLMEQRDGWFTRTRRTIETLVALSGQKVVMFSHSYGENVARNFLVWAEARQPGWVDTHMHAHAAIAGTVLGVPKAITAVLSGEMRDTAQLGAVASFLTDQLIPRPGRAKLFRSWASLLAMMPVGGPKVWGNDTWAPDDTPDMVAANRSYGAMITSAPLRARVREAAQQAEQAGSSNDDARELISRAATTERERAQRHNGSEIQADASFDGAAPLANASQDAGQGDSAGGFIDSLRDWFTAQDEGAAADAGLMDASQLHRMHSGQAIVTAVRAAGQLMPAHYRDWGAVHGPGDMARQAAGGQLLPLLHNPLTTPLPAAPSFKQLCLYGVGVPTERAYHYIHPDGWAGPAGEADAARRPNGTAGEAAGIEGTYEWQINTALNDPAVDLDRGVLMQEGDLTVPLISLGAMCRGGWRSRRLNPAGVHVITREYAHTTGALFQDTRRNNPGASSHIDILGNEELLTDMLLLVADPGEGGGAVELHGNDGQPRVFTDHVVSRIDDIVGRIPWEDPDGWE